MGLITNMVTAGDYKNADVKLKGLKNKPVLIVKGLFGKKEIEINKKNVKSINHTQVSHAEHQLDVMWSDNKKSLIVVDNSTYTAINAAMY